MVTYWCITCTVSVSRAREGRIPSGGYQRGHTIQLKHWYTILGKHTRPPVESRWEKIAAKISAHQFIIYIFFLLLFKNVVYFSAFLEIYYNIILYNIITLFFNAWAFFCECAELLIHWLLWVNGITIALHSVYDYAKKLNNMVNTSIRHHKGLFLYI